MTFPFENDGDYAYGFTPSGCFTLITPEGAPLLEFASVLLWKLASHLLWMTFWMLPIFFVSPLFIPCIFVHLFLFGCRLTPLLIRGGMRPLCFPPLWVRLTRRLEKGGGEALLKKHQLETHPGLLVNLALTQTPTQGIETLRRALALAPDHPILQQMVTESVRFFVEASPTTLPTVDSPPLRSSR